jgi:hypothetical protein
MKILTLTTYQGYNYGASLQAYALQTYLKERGHETEIIRFEPEYLMRYYAFWYVNPESKLSRNIATRMLYRIMKWAHRQTTMKRKRVFDFFNHRILKETEHVWRSSRELTDCPPKADMYLCGSDQIWNVLYEAGQDPVFYLEFVKEGKKASYAASFSYTDLPEEHYRRIQRSLLKFDHVSVREYQGKELLDRMGVQGTWVLDPVFLLPNSAWDALAGGIDDGSINSYIRYEELTEKYLLIYDFEGNEQLKMYAQEYARKKDLKIYAITDRFPLAYADRNFKHAGPADFVRLIKGCEAFFSNSFHGTAFSIIFHKPVFVFKRQLHKVNSRMESLLTLFELKDCIVDEGADYDRLMERCFDWERIEQIRKEQLGVSVRYLKEIGV